jgi:hypothetical protein
MILLNRNRLFFECGLLALQSDWVLTTAKKGDGGPCSLFKLCSVKSVFGDSQGRGKLYWSYVVVVVQGFAILKLDIKYDSENIALTVSILGKLLRKTF